MHLAVPFLLLGFVVLQHNVRAEALASPIQSADNGAGRSNSARRLRAPLMGRALLSLSEEEDAVVANLKHLESGSKSASNDEQSVMLSKRRYSAPLFGRRWINAKRRGPLFG